MDQRTEPAQRTQLYRELLEAARAASKHSYCPHSKFRVGAALLTRDGLIITGCNIENDNFADSICAERTAMVKALSEGHKSFEAIAVVSPNAPACWPCGVCRQFVSQFADGLQVVVEEAGGKIKSIPFGELLTIS